MLLPSISESKYEEILIKKFTNFSRKAPILLSFILCIQDGKRGILVTHVNSNTKYFFEINYDAQIKDFIAGIKTFLSMRHYPRLIEEILVKHELTAEEQAKELEEGKQLKDLKKIELRTAGVRQYTIDKVLAWKNIFILKLEKSSYPEDQDEIGNFFLYKYQGSAIIYLKKYRSGYDSIESLSNTFFNSALLIKKLNSEKDEG